MSDGRSEAEEPIRLERRGRVGIVTIDRPGRRNALNLQVKSGIVRAVQFGDACRKPTLVGGQMLTLQDRSVLHTMGESVDRRLMRYRSAPYAAVVTRYR